MTAMLRSIVTVTISQSSLMSVLRCSNIQWRLLTFESEEGSSSTEKQLDQRQLLSAIPALQSLFLRPVILCY
jgi:hypothetical protein